MRHITRREFIQGTALAGAALYFPWEGVARAAGVPAGMGGGMGGVMVIDPPLGPAFRSPYLAQNESTDPGVFEVSLEARRAPINVNGTTANLLTYNGRFPGPMIRVRRDQLLRLNFRNGLPDDGQTNFLGHDTRVTNVHTHGLHVSPGDNENGTHSDNMLVGLKPGEGTVYEYDLTKHPAGNLNFYHPHIHGSVTDQMWGGLSAPLIIEDEISALSAYPQKVMVLKDITLAGTEPAPHTTRMQYMAGAEGDVVMVNGLVNPRLDIRPGAVQRWRLVNACTARFFRLKLTGHMLRLVGTDGGLLDKPYQVKELLLAPGERADILVRAGGPPGRYKLLSLPYDRGMMTMRQQVTLLTLNYSGTPRKMALPTVVDPSARRVTMDLSSLPRKQISLEMGMGGMGGGMGAMVSINGITYVDHEHCFMTMSDLDTWEIWEVTNKSSMDHPFHHHTNSAQVLSITGGDSGYASLYTTTPAWKDVTILPKNGKVELLMPVMDYTGMAMIHCHIIEHEDLGMMGVWHINGEMA